MSQQEQNNRPNKHRTKYYNILKYPSGEIIAEGIILRDWCIENGYDVSNLLKTEGAKLNNPSSRYNRHHHRNLRVELV